MERQVTLKHPHRNGRPPAVFLARDGAYVASQRELRDTQRPPPWLCCRRVDFTIMALMEKFGYSAERVQRNNGMFASYQCTKFRPHCAEKG